jgi:hypothetical protein
MEFRRLYLRVWKVIAIVSNMESELRPEEELAVAERAAVAPWIDYAPTPWWYAPTAGLLAGALVLLPGERQSLHPVAFVAAVVLVVLLAGAWIGAAASRQGAVPRLRQAPAEFVPAIRAYFVGYALLVATVAALYFAVDSRLGAVAASVGVVGGLLRYERRYAQAAAAVRKRLG